MRLATVFVFLALVCACQAQTRTKRELLSPSPDLLTKTIGNVQNDATRTITEGLDGIVNKLEQDVDSGVNNLSNDAPECKELINALRNSDKNVFDSVRFCIATQVPLSTCISGTGIKSLVEQIRVTGDKLKNCIVEKYTNKKNSIDKLLGYVNAILRPIVALITMALRFG